MKLTFRIAAWIVLSSTHTMGAIAIIGPSYVAYTLGFIGVVVLYERLLMA
jgi:hypothetical protein